MSIAGGWFGISTYPAWAVGVPSFGFEFLGIFAVEVLASVHGVDGILHDLAFGDENWRFAVFASSEREDGVDYSCTSVSGDDRV